jgi:hypothetical protein
VSDLRRPQWVALLVVASTVSWRGGTYYSGGVDPVVAAKALLSVAAMVLALRTVPALNHIRRGTRSFWMLGSYLAASLFGAWAAGNTLASGVLALRLVILAVTVYLLLRAFAAELVFRCFVRSCAAIASVAAITGAGTIASGRLQGGIPPLAPNELAFLCAVTVIGLAWRLAHRAGSRRDFVLLVIFIGIIWLTGSRTGLLALVAALAVLMVQVRRWPPVAFLAVVAALPAAFYAIVGAGLLTKFLDRGGSANVSTLSNRTVAWSAASDLYHTMWAHAFGSGLSVKKIPVAGQWWNTQILDSSWVSALVQAGIVGIVVLGLWSVMAMVGAMACARPERLLWTSVIVYLLLRSVLESGLLDATPAFCFFFLISVAGERASRLERGPSQSGQPAVVGSS